MLQILTFSICNAKPVSLKVVFHGQSLADPVSTIRYLMELNSLEMPAANIF